jgi:hypothetical protein
MAQPAFDVMTATEYESNGQKKTRWARIGVAFPLNGKEGFQIILDALPLSGKLVLMPPKPRESGNDGPGF